MPGRIHTSAAAPPRTRATAGKQRPNREPRTTAQRQQQHTRRSVQDKLLEAHDDPDKILRRPRRGRASEPKVSAKSDGLAVAAVVADAPGRISSERSIGYLPVDSRDCTDSVEEDTLESWYRNVGYLVPLDESAIDVLEQVLPLFSIPMSAIKRKFHKTHFDRSKGFKDRNVEVELSVPPDPFLQQFHDMKPFQGPSIHLPDLHEKVKKYHIDEWRLDLEKANKDQLEATFQRTVMMSMLDRFRLMYSLRDGDQPILDFAVESPWNCPFMPTRALKQDKPDRQRVLSRPKPDLSVAFHLRSIIGDGLIDAIPEATKRIMMYEGQAATRTQRAFHFLMIEAKNADKSSTDTDGQLQSLNSASQSLHCLYEFFHEADRQEVECDKSCCKPGALPTTDNAGGQSPPAACAEEDTFVGQFFKEVRVFTAVSTGKAITLRVHRACPASKHPFPSKDGRPEFKLKILPDYPLQFEYNEVIQLTNDEFNRERLVDMFRKIMVDYGIGQLRPLLHRAATAIATKFYNWGEERHGGRKQYELGMRHYSHGQTAPAPSRLSSQAGSQATRWFSDSDRSSSRPPSRTYLGSSRVSTDSPEAHFSVTSQPMQSQVEPPRKRTRKR